MKDTMSTIEKKHPRPRYMSQANYIIPPGETLSSESETEQHGWIPPFMQIQNLIDAGERLDDYRKFVYNFDDMEEINMDELTTDPTRDPGFDPADASRIQMELHVKQRMAEYAQNQTKKRDEEAPKAEQKGLETTQKQQEKQQTPHEGDKGAKEGAGKE